MNRRRLIVDGMALAAGVGLSPLRLVSQETASTRATTQLEPEGFFTVEQRRNHWWFVDPAGKPFFSIDSNRKRAGGN